MPWRNSSSRKKRATARRGRGRRTSALRRRCIFEPVEQLRAVGADDARLRIMDVGVDQAGQDQLAGMVVDRRVLSARWRESRALRRRRRSARRRSAPRRRRRAARRARRRGADRRGSVRMRPRTIRCRHARISSMRSAAMRSISASAVLNSAAGSCCSRVSNAARISALVLPLTARMNGTPKRAR